MNASIFSLTRFSLTRPLLILSSLMILTGLAPIYAETASTQAVLTFIVLPNSTNMNPEESSQQENARSPYNGDTMTSTLVPSGPYSRRVWVAI